MDLGVFFTTPSELEQIVGTWAASVYPRQKSLVSLGMMVQADNKDEIVSDILVGMRDVMRVAEWLYTSLASSFLWCNIPWQISNSYFEA